MIDISQTELLDNSNSELQRRLHTALPARVTSFNASSQTVQVELMIEQVDYDGNQLAMPPLVDVPVYMFSYGEYYIAAAPVAGDEGLVIFSERCIDGWFASGNKSIPLDIRFHDLSDGFFIGGFKSAPNALSVQAGSLYMGNGSTGITISDGTITLAGNVVITGNNNINGGINVDGEGIIDGINVSGHKHGGVQVGDGTSGEAQ